MIIDLNEYDKRVQPIEAKILKGFHEFQGKSVIILEGLQNPYIIRYVNKILENENMKEWETIEKIHYLLQADEINKYQKADKLEKAYDIVIIVENDINDYLNKGK